jgi:hypothetical protein
LTLTQYDGGTFAPTFTDLQGIVAADTASMLTNYLRSGVANNSYLKLTGGTLSGTIFNSWVNASSSAPFNNGAVRSTTTQNLRSANGGSSDRVTHYYTASSDEVGSPSVSMYFGRFNGFYNQANIIYDASIYYHNTNQFYYRAFSESENKVTFSIKPSFTVNTITGTKADLYLSGDGQIDRSLNIGTTLGVTGATTLSSTLAVTGNITEGGNNVMTNLDTVNLSSRINGKVGLTGNETIAGEKTFGNQVNMSGQITISGSVSGANRLLGKNTSNNGVGDITLGTGLTLTSNTLTATNPTEKYYFDLGIFAGAADNSNATYDFTYGSNILVIPTSLNGY